MRTTILDDYIMTCLRNREAMPVFNMMTQALAETTPAAYMWNGKRDQLLVTGLAPKPVDWPEPAMCLYTPIGITAGLHRFCVDVDHTEDEFEQWFYKRSWYLEGVLIFQQGPLSFDVVPLVRETQQGTAVLSEMQLHFELVDGAWCWRKADTGPVNALFHDVFIRDMPQEELDEVHEAVGYLGNVMNLYLGTYQQHIAQAGSWFVCPARAAKVKKGKDGRVTKIYRQATTGYKEYIAGKVVTEEKQHDSVTSGDAK